MYYIIIYYSKNEPKYKISLNRFYYPGIDISSEQQQHKISQQITQFRADTADDTGCVICETKAETNDCDQSPSIRQWKMKA